MNKSETPTYVRLDEQTEEIVLTLASEKSLSKSAAIRMIIREWANFKKNFVAVRKVGVIRGEKVIFDEVGE